VKKTISFHQVLATIGAVLVFLNGLFLVAAIIPSKITVENFKNYPTYFSNLSEKRILKSNFVTNYNNLGRVDVLFKNPILESRDELKIRLLAENGTEIVSKDFSGFNLGDTSHARIDIPRGTVRSGENLEIEVAITKVVDGKLSVGTKNDFLNFIQYYDSTSRRDIFIRFGNIWAKVLSQPIVLVLPLVLGVLAVW